jgi:hypothetical protein
MARWLRRLHIGVGAKMRHPGHWGYTADMKIIYLFGK